MAAKTPMVVVLNDGEEIRGWIEWYDKHCLKVNRERGPNLLIPKRLDQVPLQGGGGGAAGREQVVEGARVEGLGSREGARNTRRSADR